jgi:hypothetical protein
MESRIRIPLQGYVQQIGGTSDFFADNWLGPNFRAVFRPALDITGLHLKLRVPEFFPAFHISLDLNGTQAGEWEIAPGRPLDLQLAMAMPKGRDFSFTLKSATSVNCKQKGISDDARDLSALLEQFIFMHQES